MIFGVCSRHVLNTSYLKSDFGAIERKMQGEVERIGRKKLREKFRKSLGMPIALRERARPMSNEFRLSLGKKFVSFWLGWQDGKGQAKKFRSESSSTSRCEVISFVRRGPDDYTVQAFRGIKIA
jgi:hypothetical protein